MGDRFVGVPRLVAFLALSNGDFVEVDGLNGDFYSGIDQMHVGTEIDPQMVISAMLAADGLSLDS